MATCKGIKADGSRCRGEKLISGTEYCWFHDPEKSEERAKASSKGGSKHHYRKIISLPRIKQAKDILKLLNKAIAEIERLESAETRAILLLRAVGMGSKALQVSDLEERILAIWQRLGMDDNK